MTGNYIKSRGATTSVLRLQGMAIQENEALQLNELFFTPGFHIIEIEASHLFSHIVSSYLRSPGRTLGVIGWQAELLKHFEGVVDVQEYIRKHKFFNYHTLVAYLLDEVSFDSLWIEVDAELSMQPWFGQLYHALLDYAQLINLSVFMMYPLGFHG